MVTGATDLGFRDTNTHPDVYVRDMTSRTYTLVSANAAGDNAGNGMSGRFDILPPTAPMSTSCPSATTGR